MLIKIIGGHGGSAPGFRTTSYLVDGKLLIDAGSVASGLPVADQKNIDNILISHPHLDHIGDLAFLCDNCFGMRGGPFNVYSNPLVKRAILQHLFNDVIWPNFSKLPSVKHPTIAFHEIIPEKILQLDDYRILPVTVNHPGDGMGFIVEKNHSAVVFTLDTGPTERIWELAKGYSNLKAIFSEISFPNHLQKVASASFHHTPQTFLLEMKKMPSSVPIFVGHLKPGFQLELSQEIASLGSSRISILSSDNANYVL